MEAIRGHRGAIMGHLGAIRGHLRALRSHLGAIRSLLGAIISLMLEKTTTNKQANSIGKTAIFAYDDEDKPYEAVSELSCGVLQPS